MKPTLSICALTTLFLHLQNTMASYADCHNLSGSIFGANYNTLQPTFNCGKITSACLNDVVSKIPGLTEKRSALTTIRTHCDGQGNKKYDPAANFDFADVAALLAAVDPVDDSQLDISMNQFQANGGENCLVLKDLANYLQHDGLLKAISPECFAKVQDPLVGLSKTNLLALNHRALAPVINSMSDDVVSSFDLTVLQKISEQPGNKLPEAIAKFPKLKKVVVDNFYSMDNLNFRKKYTIIEQRAMGLRVKLAHFILSDLTEAEVEDQIKNDPKDVVAILHAVIDKTLPTSGQFIEFVGKHIKDFDYDSLNQFGVFDEKCILALQSHAGMNLAVVADRVVLSNTPSYDKLFLVLLAKAFDKLDDAVLNGLTVGTIKYIAGISGNTLKSLMLRTSKPVPNPFRQKFIDNFYIFPKSFTDTFQATDRGNIGIPALKSVDFSQAATVNALDEMTVASQIIAHPNAVIQCLNTHAKNGTAGTVSNFIAHVANHLDDFSEEMLLSNLFDAPIVLLFIDVMPTRLSNALKKEPLSFFLRKVSENLDRFHEDILNTITDGRALTMLSEYENNRTREAALKAGPGPFVDAIKENYSQLSESQFRQELTAADKKALGILEELSFANDSGKLNSLSEDEVKDGLKQNGLNMFEIVKEIVATGKECLYTPFLTLVSKYWAIMPPHTICRVKDEIDEKIIKAFAAISTTDWLGFLKRLDTHHIGGISKNLDLLPADVINNFPSRFINEVNKNDGQKIKEIVLGGKNRPFARMVLSSKLDLSSWESAAIEMLTAEFAPNIDSNTVFLTSTGNCIFDPANISLKAIQNAQYLVTEKDLAACCKNMSNSTLKQLSGITVSDECSSQANKSDDFTMLQIENRFIENKKISQKNFEDMIAANSSICKAKTYIRELPYLNSPSVKKCIENLRGTLKEKEKWENIGPNIANLHIDVFGLLDREGAETLDHEALKNIENKQLEKLPVLPDSTQKDSDANKNHACAHFMLEHVAAKMEKADKVKQICHDKKFKSSAVVINVTIGLLAVSVMSALLV